MDFYLLGHSLQIPSVPLVPDQDIPSFEEAFDADSLRKFYKRQGEFGGFPLKCQTVFGVEEDTGSQTLESVSPATTIQSHGFLDLFQDDIPEPFHRSDPTLIEKLQNSLGPFHPNQNEMREPRRIMFHTQNDTSMQIENRRKEERKNGEPTDLIAMLCQQIQQYYPEDSQHQDPLSEMNHAQELIKPMKEQGQFTSRKTSGAWNEYNIDDTVLRKLISKKRMFVVDRSKKPFNVVMKKNSMIPKSKKKSISIQFANDAEPEPSELISEKSKSEKKEKAEKKEKKEKKGGKTSRLCKLVLT